MILRLAWVSLHVAAPDMTMTYINTWLTAAGPQDQFSKQVPEEIWSGKRLRNTGDMRGTLHGMRMCREAC